MSAPLQFEVVTHASAFAALQHEWDALWQGSSHARLPQSFNYCSKVWNSIAQPQGHTLFCVAGRTDGRLTLIWPLLGYRRSIWRFLKPIGATGFEYSDLLIEEGADRRSSIEATWNFVKACSGSNGADLIVIPCVPAGTCLDRTLSASGPTAAVGTDVAFATNPPEGTTWDAYSNSLSKRHRSSLSSAKKRLAKLGRLDFDVLLAGDPRLPERIRWMLDQKQVWAQRTGKRGDFFFTQGYQDFLVALLMEANAEPRRVLFTLTLDDAPIAVKVATIGKGVLELLVGGFDARLARSSPGMRLDEYWIRWAIEQNFNIDFGTGDEYYKRFWTNNHQIQTHSYRIPCSLSGRTVLAIQRRLRQWKTRRAPTPSATPTPEPSH